MQANGTALCNVRMSALQQFLCYLFQGSLCCLGSLRITTGHSYYYKKMDEFGNNYAASILKKVEDESQRLTNTHQTPAEPPSTAASIIHEIYKVIHSLILPISIGKG